MKLVGFYIPFFISVVPTLATGKSSHLLTSIGEEASNTFKGNYREPHLVNFLVNDIGDLAKGESDGKT